MISLFSANIMTMNRLNSLILLFAAVFMLSSCIQDDFDTPPVYIPPSIDASQVMNIGDLLTSNNLLGNCDLVSPTLLSGATYEGKYIKGVVTSDDLQVTSTNPCDSDATELYR